MGPSLTLKVNVTAPGAAQVNWTVAALALSKVPLGADQAYVKPPGFGPDADALTVTELPTVVSLGLVLTEFHVAQLKVVAVMRADPESCGFVLQLSATLTFVVVRATTLKVAEPAQVTVPSAEVPVSETR